MFQINKVLIIWGYMFYLYLWRRNWNLFLLIFSRHNLKLINNSDCILICLVETYFEWVGETRGGLLVCWGQWEACSCEHDKISWPLKVTLPGLPSFTPRLWVPQHRDSKCVSAPWFNGFINRAQTVLPARLYASLLIRPHCSKPIQLGGLFCSRGKKRVMAEG